MTAVRATVMVVGGGGREHAVVRALRRSPSAPLVIAAPGNPGIAADAEVHPVPVDDHGALVALARDRGVDLAVVGPEAPLVDGLADALRAAGVRCFGPSRAAARLEGSKAFAKEVMAAAGVATARHRTVGTVAEGVRAVRALGTPVAVKADGLAAGKGVVVAATTAEAREALEASLVARAHGDAGAAVVVEEGLTGPEVSLLALSDGARVVGLPAARDYKRARDGDRGPNTGGMGAVSPVPDVPHDLAERLLDEVHRPVVAEMARRGAPFSGVLYAGLMLTADGPRVLEFNVRFGDPEAQAVLPRLGGDLLELLAAGADGRLPERAPESAPDTCVAVVLACAGYPTHPRVGDVIEGVEEAARLAEVLHAGTALDDAGRLVTAGGRVLAVAGRGDGAPQARRRAYAAADLIRFRGRRMRRDIAARLDRPGRGTRGA
jgi:phosphoribosylamine--glycine ligase